MNFIKNLFLTMTLLAGAMYSSAQEIGSWQIYPSFCPPAQKTIVTPGMVYYISGGNLFSYDTKNEETYQYSTDNRLTDTNITGAYYNPEGKYLAVFYDTGNIDLIYDDGTARNFSDIASSDIDKPVTVNDVYFDGNNMYLATNFGLVHYNVSRGEVVQSANFKMPVYGITGVGDRLVMKVDGYICSIEKGKRLASMEALTKHYAYTDNPMELIGIDDGSFLAFINNAGSVIVRHTLDFSTGAHTVSNCAPQRKTKVPPYLIHGADGRIFYHANNILYTLDDDLKEQRLTDLPEEFASMKVGTWKGIDEIWSLNPEGIACHGFDGEGGMTTLSERYRPNNLSVRRICYFFPSHDGRRLFMQNNGLTVYKFGTPATRGLDVIQNAACLDIDNGTFRDFTCYPVEARQPYLRSLQNTMGFYPISPTSLAPDPDDEDIVFLATADDGVYKVRGTEFIGRFDETNSLIGKFDNRNIIYGISIDPYGNLWVATYNEGYTRSPLMVLPASKRRLDPADITREDWVDIDMSSIDYWGGQDVRFLHCRKSNIMVVINHTIGEIVLLYDNNGTPYDFSDDSFRCFESALIDQDGNSVRPLHTSSVLEDHDGRVWVGTDIGIFEITNLKNAIKSGENRVSHIKVPRNDGTNAADYLLGTDHIMDMTVDAANRKWIATEGSGLFLVSPTGNEVLANFNTDNSPLPTNEIYAVYADPTGSTIYVGTPVGLLSYRSNATPARDDYDEILAYPNPVRPEYSGSVYITGLKENTLVKIADSSGAVLHQGRSEGGLYVWDATTSTGARVRSGVYYVLVSSASDGKSSGAVTKIMVIN